MQNSLTVSICLSIIAILQTCGAHVIDVSGCGESKGCFRNPEGCDAASCEYLLTWREDGDNVRFEMSAPVDSAHSYVAFALSHDKLMVMHHFLYLSLIHI